MEKKLITYHDGDAVLEASIAFPEKEGAPVVLVCHAWSGRDGFVQEAIERIAGWGYIGFAIDVYGKGIVGKSMEENARLKAPFLKDRMMLQRRLLKGLEEAKKYATKIYVLGFGFGGLCALDLARSDPTIAGVVCIYGHFEEAPGLENRAIKAKVLILHGAEDRIVPVDEVYALGDALTQCKIPWQAHIFDHTLHAFMNPQVNAPDRGVQYQPQSAEKAWKLTRMFISG